MNKKHFKYRLSHYRNIYKAAHEWENYYSEDLKDDLRCYLTKEFDEKCFFCQREFKQGNAKIEIEHVTHKSKYKEFTFRPENLTIACSYCNLYKGTKEALIDSLRKNNYKYKEYPLNSTDYLIVHPYFDQYDKHIEIEGEIFYTAKNGSPKGTETISMCYLTRPKLAEDIAKELLNQAEEHRKFSRAHNLGSDEEIEELVKKYFNLPFDINEFLNAIISITESNNIIKISRKLLSINNIDKINSKNWNIIKHLYNLNGSFLHFLDVLEYIESRQEIKNKIITFLGDPSLASYFYLTETSYATLKSAISSSSISIHYQSKAKFSSLLNQISPTQIDIRSFSFFIKNRAEILDLCKFVKEIHSNKKLVNLLNKTTNDLIQIINDNLGKLGNWAKYNPEFIVLNKLKFIKEITSLNMRTVNKLLKALEDL